LSKLDFFQKFVFPKGRKKLKGSGVKNKKKLIPVPMPPRIPSLPSFPLPSHTHSPAADKTAFDGKCPFKKKKN